MVRDLGRSRLTGMDVQVVFSFSWVVLGEVLSVDSTVPGLVSVGVYCGRIVLGKASLRNVYEVGVRFLSLRIFGFEDERQGTSDVLSLSLGPCKVLLYFPSYELTFLCFPSYELTPPVTHRTPLRLVPLQDGFGGLYGSTGSRAVVTSPLPSNLLPIFCCSPTFPSPLCLLLQRPYTPGIRTILGRPGGQTRSCLVVRSESVFPGFRNNCRCTPGKETGRF